MVANGLKLLKKSMEEQINVSRIDFLLFLRISKTKLKIKKVKKSLKT